MASPRLFKRDILHVSLHFSWRSLLWKLHANLVILLKTSTKLKVQMKVMRLSTWLQLRNSPFPHFTWRNGLTLMSSPSATLVFQAASEKRLVLMDVTYGASSESISSKKSNSSFIVTQRLPGKNSTIWLHPQKLSTKASNFPTKLLTLQVEHLMMPQLWSMIWRPGSQVTMPSANSWAAQTVLISNHVP